MCVCALCCVCIHVLCVGVFVYINLVCVVFYTHSCLCTCRAMVKVSGELAVSFPSSCVGQLLIHEEFRFVLMGDLNKLRNVLHNTQFVLKYVPD